VIFLIYLIIVIYSCYARYGKLRLRPVRDDMLVENDRINFPRPVGMQCW
jgi:hypothetical protein